MIIQRGTHQGMEIAKWLILFALAASLLALIASQIGAVEPERAAGPYPADMVMQVWETLEVQRSGQHAEALARWEWTPVAPHAEAWRQLAMARAMLAVGRFADAEAALEEARILEPDNAVEAYLRGLLLLEKAMGTPPNDDATQPARMLWAGYVPALTPPAKVVWEQAALEELETAIELAGMVPLELPLVPLGWQTEAMVYPTVGDLLAAMGAQDFDAQAHNLLGPLCLKYRTADEAELHLDAARVRGLAVVDQYAELARAYERENRHGDAIRAYAKDLQSGVHVARPLRGIFRNLQRAMGEML